MVVRIQTQRIDWSDGALDFLIDVAADGAVTLARLSARRGDEAPAPGAGLPLCDLLLTGTGRIWSGSRYAESAAGRRLRYVTHEESEEDGWRQLRVALEDLVTGIRAEVFYRVLAGHGVLRTWVGLVNGGPQPVTVESVTSFLAGGLPGWPEASHSADQGSAYLADLDLLWAENDWLAEGRWQRRPLRDMLPDLNRDAHHWLIPADARVSPARERGPPAVCCRWAR